MYWRVADVGTGLPTVDHIETRNASPSWQFVEDVRSKKRMRNRENT